MIHRRPIRYTDALRHTATKRLLPLAFSTAEIEEYLPAQIRRLSFYSARTADLMYLAHTQSLIQSIVAPAVAINADGSLRRTGPGESINKVLARSRMKQHLRAINYQPAPDDAGGLKDLSSDRRINLILNTQTAMARGYARDRAANQPAILQAFPADRLYRAFTRRAERNWQERWNTARAQLADRTSATLADSRSGPFIAPKPDPIWTAISRFGNPYAPFDYGSGMRKRSVPASLAATHGIDKTPRPAADPLAVGVETTIPPGMPPAMLQAVRDAFADSAMVSGGKLRISPPGRSAIPWLIDKARANVQAATPIRFLSPAERNAIAAAADIDLPEHATLDMDSTSLRHLLNRHGDAGKEMRTYGVRPVTDADIAAVPALVADAAATWTKPTADDYPTRKGAAVVCESQGLRIVFSSSARQDRPRISLYTMHHVKKEKGE
jgi:hypothetical protein